ncbi:tRNA 2-thiouridine(34) synthase MnmA [Patescibacteria group bacterium]|nr:tRNA 2-thiouridine(34) synthase MnmA [Patescibacteria group bacterium]
MNKKILCAISGGVDSSVAALILKQKRFDVIGVFMNFWNENEKNNKCCSIESARIARIVAQKLKIKLYSLNYKELFRKKVVSYYIRGCENGQTPNPCVVCNREIKFGRLLGVARDLECSKLATGHYAQIVKNNHNFRLLRGIDKKKDQSYFLWQIPSSSLSSIEFPIGSMRKSEVRKTAKKFKLPTYNKKDSQGLCFVGKSNIKFLAKHVQKLLEPGNVVDKNNNIIGRHQGLALYTIGQRAGFSVTNDKWRKQKSDVPPLYVMKLETKKNNLVVGEDKDTFSRSMIVSNLNWLAPPQTGLLAQIRYQYLAVKCTLSKVNQNKIRVNFLKPQRAVTPGQSCVFYHQDRLLGGGIIKDED